MSSITPEKASMICRMEAPYPLNYLPSGDDQQKVLGMFIGLMIHKKMFYQRTKGGAP